MQITYGDRNEKLKHLGFPTYQDYLASELWGTIKEAAFKRWGRNCLLCDKTAEVIHHFSYGWGVLKGTKLEALKPLCHQCHKIVEFDKQGKKRMLAEAQKQFLRMYKKAKYSKKQTLEGRLTLPGYCQKCGNKAAKRSLLCGPCGKGKKSKPWIDLKHKAKWQARRRSR